MEELRKQIYHVRLDAENAMLNGPDKPFGVAVSELLRAIEAEIDEIEATHERQLEYLEEDTTETANIIQNLEGEVDDLETEIYALKATISDLEGQLEDIEKL